MGQRYKKKMSKLFHNLNQEQLAAVKHTNGPLLIVAGAGTGKTTVITRRIAYLIEQNLAKPDEILALTFTDKAATEMQERVDLLLPLGYVDTWISTFHSFCERILKNYALDIGLPNDFELLDDTRQWLLLHNNFDKLHLEYYRPMGNPSKFISALLGHFSKCKDELISPKDYLNYAEELKLSKDTLLKTGELEPLRIAELANAYHIYQKLLIDNNYLDFGDLINYTLELFEKRPGILKFYQQHFKFIMVDEFQDTNFAQYKLVKMLSGNEKNIAVVGDDDQSIYKFRGASVSNILKFKDDFPELNEITLVENYRSSKEILDIAYKFIQQNNPDRLEFKLKINKELKSNTKDPGAVEVIEADDLNGELNTVAKKVLELKTNKNTWNDFAILIRSNNAAEELLPVLQNYGIPHTFYANTGLYKKPIILDLLAYLKLLDNVNDSFSLYRVLNLALFRLEINDIANFLEFSRKKTLSLYEALEKIHGHNLIKKDSEKKLNLLHTYLKKHFQLCQEKPVTEIFVDVVKDLQIAERIEEETLENSENRELIEQFYKKIERFESENLDKSLHNFLWQLSLEEEAGDEGKINFDPNSGPESLKIMTIHSSKGLEFENVFVINMVDKRFPSVSKRDVIEIPKNLVKDILPEGDFHLQEERRLFYVALTRAKRHLYLTWSKNYGGKQNKKPSIFLVEAGLLPSEKINKATGKVVFVKSRKKQTTNVISIPEKFSYSQLKDFETCPLKYKYQYYLKLPVKGNKYLSFGNTIHKTFEEYLKQFKLQSNFSQPDLFGQSEKTPELPEYKILEKFYEKNWIDDWYDTKKQKEEFFKLGKQMLKKFFDYSSHNLPTPKYIEQSFFLFLGNYKLVGRIDRADSNKNGLIIYDYKTGKLPNKSEKKDIDQLYIYQWAAEEYLKEKVCALKYWYLKEDENQFLSEPLANKNDVEKLKTELLNLIERVVETIKTDSFKEEHAQTKQHSCEFEFFK